LVVYIPLNWLDTLQALGLAEAPGGDGLFELIRTGIHIS
jgi:hypothetical protein